MEKSRQADARRIAASRRTEQAAFYVPINVYMHSLLFSLYAFIGEHGEQAGEHAGEQQSSRDVHQQVAAAIGRSGPALVVGDNLHRVERGAL